MTVRILSLDIDGVLHPPDAIKDMKISDMIFSPEPTIEKHNLFRWCAQLEESLKDAPDVCVLIHSSWRKQHWATNAFFHQALGPLSHRFLGISQADLDREESIQSFCDRLQIDAADILIVDDAHNEFKQGVHTPNLIVTNPLIGINDEAILEQITHWALHDATRQQHCAPCAN